MTHSRIDRAKQTSRSVAAFVAGALLVTGLAAGQETPARASDALGRLPLAFVKNDGQWQAPARFVVRHHGQIARFEQDAIVLQLTHDAEDETRGALLRLRFEGASSTATVEGVAQQRCRYNYFLGSDPENWRADVPAFSEVVYRQIQPGVDVRVRDNAGNLEYDLVLAPGADLSKVVIHCEGAKSVELSADGVLSLETELGTIRQTLPLTWLESASGEREPVECRYRKIDGERFGFEVAARDTSRKLVIDPHLDWSTYLGGSGDDVCYDAVVEDSGIVDVCGTTHSSSTTFPTMNPFQANLHGASDAFCARFDPTQTGANQLLWCTYYGGTGNEWGWSIEVEPSGVIDIAGKTDSTKVPTAGNSYSSTSAGGQDAFVARFDWKQTGIHQLVWATMVGGTGDDACFLGGHCVSSAGIITVAINTNSTDFPMAGSSLQPSNGGGKWDAGFAQFDPSQIALAQLIYSTYYGGTGFDNALQVTVDPAGVVTLGGWTDSTNLTTTVGAFSASNSGGLDAFIARIDPSLAPPSQLIYSTYFGGLKDEGINDVSLDAAGKIYFTGSVMSNNLPTTAGAFDTSFNGPTNSYDAYLAVLDPSQVGAAQLAYSTYFGGSNSFDYGFELQLGRSGEVTIVGETASNDLPTTAGAYQPSYNGGVDAFVLKIRPAGNGAADLTYCTYLGDAGAEHPALGGALDSNDYPIVVGETNSTSFPTSSGAFQTTNAGGYDCFITRLALASWFNYGAGLAGTNGVPTFTSQSNPVIGGALTLDLGDSLGASTSALLLVGLSDANIPAAGGTLLVNAFLFLPISVPASGLPMSGSIPNDPTLTGVSVYLQALELDPVAVHGIAFTPGLRLILGY